MSDDMPVPWSPGYDERKRRLLLESLSNAELLVRFRRGEPLPAGYGVGADERCVEYPWLLANLEDRPERMLDAGSCLNWWLVLDQPLIARRTLHIMTLAPEPKCYWQRGISYLYGDLRDIPIRDGYYDSIACLSTLEHIGCDNTSYAPGETHRESRPEDFALVVRELRRVLRPGGTLFVTVPFGVTRDFGTFRQFDRPLLARAAEAFGPARELAEAFFRYGPAGWNFSRPEDCAGCEYVSWVARPRSEWPDPMPVEPDLAAAARAVACLRLVKADG